MSPVRSTSQRTYQREKESLAKMPTSSGRAACDGDTRFDVVSEKDRIPRTVRNEMAKVCARCLISDCGFRQVYQTTS
jgi:hypothetical protein